MFIYEAYRGAEVEASELDVECMRCGVNAWNIWVCAANTAEHAVELWQKARHVKKEEFRAAVEKARLFTDGARRSAIIARKYPYTPARDYDPKKVFLECSKKFHL